MPTADPGLYDYLPWNDRPRLTWPGDARVAFWIAPNLEVYEFDPPPNPRRTPWPRPLPDVVGHGWRDHGNRVGFWRMLDAMDRFGLRGSVSLNVALCDHHPEIIAACAARGWEFFSHGVYNTRYTYGMDEAQERAMIADVIATIRRATGQSTDGWLSPALTNTERTMELLAEAGVTYTLDLFHDDQPTPLNVKSGRMVSLPYSLELNDITCLIQAGHGPDDYATMIKAQFDRLYAEGADSGTVMCIPLHPFLIGQSHRMAAFVDALAHITGHDRVWCATGREIARWYLDHHHDAVVAHAARLKEGGR
jgi:peptidoglycan/xylan/chitin deacetylase (PgdA/CDA1 family)